MRITDEERRCLENRINEWWNVFGKYSRDGNVDRAWMVYSWLFGLKIGLAALGLHDLAAMAADGQQPSAPEK